MFSRLDAEKYDRQYKDIDLLRRIMQYLQTQKWRIIGIAVTVLLISGIEAVQPIVVSRGVDILETEKSAAPTGLIALAVLATGVTSWLFNWINRRLTVRAVSNITMKLAKDAFSAAARHDLSFYDKFSSGRIISRITTDTQDFGQLVTLITDLISQLLISVLLAVVLLRLNLTLSLLTFTIIPVTFGLAISYRKLARKVTREGMRSMANVNSAIKETVSGIIVAKNFRQESMVYKEFVDANLTSYRVNLRRGIILNILFPILNMIGGLATAILVYFGGITAKEGIVTIGSWFLFIQSLDRFLFPVLGLSNFWTQIQNGLSASERVFALIDAEPQVIQIENQPVPKIKGQIDFVNVTFSYKENETVLDNFSLHIEAGETVAIVGHTGAGKSSIAKLIERFYEFQSGKILIDGKDIRTFDLIQYRQHLGIVSQTPFLFSDTVLENIRYAKPETTEKEILEIATQIGDGEWLQTLPNGLQTMVGERGSNLSMGQRQLVSLMRVLVQKPSIFILDEATASIDPFTEWQIQQALNLILSRTTSILIAHRLSTVKAADRIITIEKGKIIEEGNHESLLKQNGHYAFLYNTYFRHQSLAYIEQVKNLLANPSMGSPIGYGE